MSDQHPDLQRFYDEMIAEANEDDDFVPSEDEYDDDELGEDDDELEYFFDADDMEDEIPDDDEEFEDDEDGEGDMEIEGVTLGEADGGQNITIEIDPSNDSSSTFLQLASLLNNYDGGDTDARTSLLARLLAGRMGPQTRSGLGGFLRRSAAQEVSAEERAEQRRKAQWWPTQKDPHPNGVELLRSGEFGRVGGCSRRERRKPKTYGGRIGGGYHGHQAALPANAMIPNTNGTVVATYPSVPYVGQYAREDYSLFFTATQNFTLHLYDVAAGRVNKTDRRTATASEPGERQRRPRRIVDDDDDDDMDGPWNRWLNAGGRTIHREETSLKSIKSVRGEEGSWTVTDADSTRQGDRMIYSSITPYVHMLHTSEDDSEHTCLDFSGGPRRGRDFYGYSSFGIWSIRFSADSKEVVAGASDGRILVYDIDAERRSLSIDGHADDVNAVCFADEGSTNILVSGSDDGYVKVWDRRSLAGGTPSGVLVGATEGITYTSPKGDGRYVVVNSKDQAARLYDLRKMRNWSEFSSEEDAVSRYGMPSYDYRMEEYRNPKRLAHPKDCSVMTFRGHSVLRTLIRCHFSPRESTGQSYIYSGSADGFIHIWSLDGRIVQILDRGASIPLKNEDGRFNDPSAAEPSKKASKGGGVGNAQSSGHVVRDVSWHGFEPTLMSTSWSLSGRARQGGSIAKHEWKGLGKGGLVKLEDWQEKQEAEAASS